MIFKYKNVTIIGSGISGISCINYLLYKKCNNISLMDTRINPPNINLIPSCINKYFGKIYNNILLRSDLIIISPGFNHNLINRKILNSIEIVNDIELFCREKINSKIISVTGTNGKSTVVSLIYNILIKNNYIVYLGGNIGNPILNSINKNYDFYILELSSFQLENLYNLKSFSSSILNIDYDHLDRHINISNYIKTKLKIYNNSNYCVINNNNILSFPNKINLYSKYEFFGINSGNYYLKSNKNIVYLMYKNNLITNSKKLKIFGIHNYLNILASIALIKNIKNNIDLTIDSIENFYPLNHRLNIILNKNKILWINDSKSTNISSVISAINSINTENCIYLILGGYKKKSNFTNLVKYIKNRNIKIFCFGKDGKNISNIFKNISFFSYKLDFLIKKIFYLIKKNDIVLFSPGCSSIDQYSDYRERGNNFIKIVKEINK